MALTPIHGRVGPVADRPAVGTRRGVRYTATDEGIEYEWTGATWVTVDDAASNDLISADVATQAELDAHTSDPTAAHAASAVSFDPATTTYAAGTETQTAIEQVDAALAALATEVTNAWESSVNLSTNPTMGAGARRLAGDGNGTVTVSLAANEELDIVYTQDATGGRAVTFSGVGVWFTLSGAAPSTSSRPANAVDRFYFENVGGVIHGHWPTESVQTLLDAKAPLRLTFNAQTGTTYTPVLGDEQKMVSLSNAAAITVTLPQDSDVAIPVGGQIHFFQLGAGQVTFSAGTGATVNASPTAKTRAQYSAVTAIKRAANTWLLMGDLAAS